VEVRRLGKLRILGFLYCVSNHNFIYVLRVNNQKNDEEEAMVGCAFLLIERKRGHMEKD
jgi:hypothetical protein